MPWYIILCIKYLHIYITCIYADILIKYLSTILKRKFSNQTKKVKKGIYIKKNIILSIIY